jgi:uncharacterized membrane protein YtjA (UPF0391 family)
LSLSGSRPAVKNSDRLRPTRRAHADRQGHPLLTDEAGGHCQLTLHQVFQLRAPQTGQRPCKEIHMLHYSVVFLVIALIAAVFGFGGIAAGAVEIAKILFFIFAVMAIVSFVVGLMKRN